MKAEDRISKNHIPGQTNRVLEKATSLRQLISRLSVKPDKVNRDSLTFTLSTLTRRI